MTIGEHKVLQNIFGAWRALAQAPREKVFCKKQKRRRNDEGGPTEHNVLLFYITHLISTSCVENEDVTGQGRPSLRRSSTLSQPAPRQSCKRHSRQDLIVEDTKWPRARSALVLPSHFCAPVESLTFRCTANDNWRAQSAPKYFRCLEGFSPGSKGESILQKKETEEERRRRPDGT